MKTHRELLKKEGCLESSLICSSGLVPTGERRDIPRFAYLSGHEVWELMESGVSTSSRGPARGPEGGRGLHRASSGSGLDGLNAHIQYSVQLSTTASSIPELKSDSSPSDIRQQNEEVALLIEKLRAAEKQAAGYIKLVKDGKVFPRPAIRRNYCPSEEALLSVQKMIQANDRDQANLEKTLKKLTDPQYTVQLTTKLQKLDSAIARVTKENKQKEVENRRVGRFLDGQEKGAESLVARHLKDLDHLSQEV